MALGAWLRDGTPGPSKFPVEMVKVVQAYKHPKFAGGGRADLMLLKLSQPVKFTSHIRPACLHADGDGDFHHAVISGWGSTAVRG